MFPNRPRRPVVVRIRVTRVRRLRQRLVGRSVAARAADAVVPAAGQVPAPVPALARAPDLDQVRDLAQAVDLPVVLAGQPPVPVRDRAVLLVDRADARVRREDSHHEFLRSEHEDQ